MNGTRGDPASLPRVCHGGKAEGGFAGPRFADQAQHLACVQSQIDAVDDGMPVFIAMTFNDNIAHFK